jgi:hypothetical protein
MSQLIADADRRMKAMKDRQSKTLQQAVAEYVRRYGIPPPPNFDKWFAFAQSRNVELIDEFDNIFEVITPFWGLKPETIRSRVREALGFDKNFLMGIQIRAGNVSNVAGAVKWQRVATVGMMNQFTEFLPDMDLAFNVHDEPRVIVPYEDMARLIRTAREVTLPAASALRRPRNSFTRKPKGINDGTQLDEVATTRFNVFAHQATWTHSRMSCNPDSPARALEEADRVDDRSTFAVGDLGFIYNTTAMSDICYSPSLGSTHGFFDRPNAYNIVQDLFPIFSQSKISSYADILYPSPWYWAGKVTYNDTQDKEWSEKEDQLYWRGSTTGGYSRNGGWKRQHRQRFVQKINGAGRAKILVDGGRSWEVKEVPRGDYRENMNVYFSHVGQCETEDCEEQKEFFTVKEHAEQHDAWSFKHLLDMDGNAFSGRFYAFLESKSLVFKLAIFREWHTDWIKPWFHYIPLSFQGDEWLEAVQFFRQGGPGERDAERLAMQGREWAKKALRLDDMEVYFFRLLLEYVYRLPALWTRHD